MYSAFYDASSAPFLHIFTLLASTASRPFLGAPHLILGPPVAYHLRGLVRKTSSYTVVQHNISTLYKRHHLLFFVAFRPSVECSRTIYTHVTYFTTSTLVQDPHKLRYSSLTSRLEKKKVKTDPLCSRWSRLSARARPGCAFLTAN